MNAPTNHQPTAAGIAERLAGLEAERDAATQSLAEAQQSLGDAALDTDREAMASAEASVTAHRQEIARLRAAEDALRKRLAEARGREAAQAHAAAWDAFEQALEERHAAFVRAEEAAAPFFAAVDAAIDAIREVWRLQPASERILTDTGWVLMSKTFESLTNLQEGELVEVRAALRDMTRKSRDDAEAKLRVRNFHTPEMMEG